MECGGGVRWWWWIALCPAAAAAARLTLEKLPRAAVLWIDYAGADQCRLPAAHSWCVGDYCVIDETGAKPTPPSKKRKSKGSLGESFAVIRSSPKVRACRGAVLCVCRGLCVCGGGLCSN